MNDTILHILLFLISGVLLLLSARWIIHGIMHVAHYLQWREFVITFFVMSVASSLPNLFVGISSARHGTPLLSFGDVVGNSVVDLTLVVALAIFFGGELSAKGTLIRISSIFTIAVAILPLLLILDMELSRGDGIALLMAFTFYSVWLFSKRREYPQPFTHTNHATAQQPVKNFRKFLFSLLGIVGGIAFLLISSEGIVRSAHFFADTFQLPSFMIGMLVLGLGNALPEIYFTITLALQKKGSIILGNLMGAVLVMSTLVLGVVAFLRPIHINDFSPFLIARIFLVISALSFLLFINTERKITRKEAIFLFGLYVAFVLAELIHHGSLDS